MSISVCFKKKEISIGLNSWISFLSARGTRTRHQVWKHPVLPRVQTRRFTKFWAILYYICKWVLTQLFFLVPQGGRLSKPGSLWGLPRGRPSVYWYQSFMTHSPSLASIGLLIIRLVPQTLISRRKHGISFQDRHRIT